MVALLEKIKQKRMAMLKVSSRDARKRKRRRAKPFLEEESEDRLAFAVSESMGCGDQGKSTTLRMSDKTNLDEEEEVEDEGFYGVEEVHREEEL